ncbi:MULTISPECIES: DUF475 domain-containing protein [unclassified Arthrobacter]|uniref:DUF475 domain-containing protein n=1 Tax=unclassified Arthrobacter TaxID=235627 RepID=UPI001D13B3B7|nr:DUF475 domain-containing protein [Arthrobacter sp. zg-Y1110]MCC3291813.1 DUF475 domain-containing protein [Arthrobacter sp. zg-Y1110]MCC3302197.1 DUF475 domain-containing protein [Arthrobacter sp. zg-Y895]UWX85644.1 DUF475 domain-containing protein [Arthrobacter sp. zg-Y1110]
MFFKTFGWSFVITAAALVTAFFYGGVEALILCAILGVLEISLSFDNAVVNARILEKMSPFWQKMFLTVGILIAVVGMRIVFPLVIVGVTASINPIEALQLALEKGDPDEPGSYGYLLHEAHPQIASFGGLFLLMIFLDFMFEDRDIRWLRWLETPFAKVGKINGASLIVGLGALLAAGALSDPSHTTDVFVAGAAGLITYLLVTGLGDMFDVDGDGDFDADDVEARAPKSGNGALVKATGKAAFMLFLYLEVIDASFSFDGVIGAFAITSDPIIIALGLGLIGAIFVRSLTVFLVKQGTLDEFVYLDHGAHWAIGALATILLLTIEIEINEVITGLIGVVFILASLTSSIVRNKRAAKSAGASKDPVYTN